MLTGNGRDWWLGTGATSYTDQPFNNLDMLFGFGCCICQSGGAVCKGEKKHESYLQSGSGNVGLLLAAAPADRNRDCLLPSRLQHPCNVQAQPLVRSRPLRLCQWNSLPQATTQSGSLGTLSVQNLSLQLAHHTTARCGMWSYLPHVKALIWWQILVTGPGSIALLYLCLACQPRVLQRTLRLLYHCLRHQKDAGTS